MLCRAADTCLSTLSTVPMDPDSTHDAGGRRCHRDRPCGASYVDAANAVVGGQRCHREPNRGVPCLGAAIAVVGGRHCHRDPLFGVSYVGAAVAVRSPQTQIARKFALEVRHESPGPMASREKLPCLLTVGVYCRCLLFWFTGRG